MVDAIEKQNKQLVRALPRWTGSRGFFVDSPGYLQLEDQIHTGLFLRLRSELRLILDSQLNYIAGYLEHSLQEQHF